MRVLVLSLIVAWATLLGACSANPSAPEAAGPETLRVATYNIRVGAGPDKALPPGECTAKLLEIAALLRELDCDIILLQEVDSGAKRSGNADQATVLGEALGYQYVFAPALDRDGGKYGIAVLSRWPILDSTAQRLYKPDYTESHPEYPDWYAEQRIVQTARIDTPMGEVLVINTHLGITEDQRIRQVEEIAMIVSTYIGTAPIILGGDFNCLPESPEIARMSAVLQIVTAPGTDASALAEAPSFPAREPDRRIDYLFVSNPFSTLSTTVVPAPLSDHLAVTAELRHENPAVKSPTSGPFR